LPSKKTKISADAERREIETVDLNLPEGGGEVCKNAVDLIKVLTKVAHHPKRQRKLRPPTPAPYQAKKRGRG